MVVIMEKKNILNLKKFINLFLIIGSLILFTLTVSTFAGCNKNEIQFHFRKIGDAYSLTEIKNVKTDELEIPSYYKGKPVVEVDSQIFSENNFRKIILPDTIREFDSGMFSNCENLEYVNIPKNIKVLPDMTFQYCKNLKNITIPDHVVKLDADVFNECKNLEKVVLPKNLNSIGYRCFGDCEKLENINIPENIKNIEDSTFYNCKKIENIELPSNLETISDRSFENCVKLQNIQIPEKVKAIGSNAFYGCVNLKSIKLPKNLENTVIDCFGNCSNLEIIEFTNNNLNFDESNFQSCGLKYLKIPSEDFFENFDKDKLIQTFNNYIINFSCENNKKIKLDYAEERAIWNCDEIGVTKDGLIFALLKNNQIVIEGSNSKKKKIIIPDEIEHNEKKYKVVKVNYKAFAGNKNLEEIEFSDNITEIGNRLFEDCSNLKKVKLPNNLEKISEGTFYYCKKLLTLNLPKNLKFIEDDAFSYCKSLEKIHLKKYIKNMEGRAFNECENLNIFIEEEKPEIWEPNKIPVVWNFKEALEIGGIKYGITNNKEIVLCGIDNQIENIEIPQYLNINHEKYFITEICNNAFRNGKKLQICKLSSKIAKIGYGAFSECQKLTYILLPKSVCNLDYCVFNKNTTVFSERESPLGHCDTEVIYNIVGVGKTDDGFVYGLSKNNKIVIGNYDEKYARSINIPKSINHNGKLYEVDSINRYAFEGLKQIIKVYIPKTIKHIGYSIFDDCSEDLRIFVAAKSKLASWSDDWNRGYSSNTIWGYEK